MPPNQAITEIELEFSSLLRIVLSTLPTMYCL